MTTVGQIEKKTQARVVALFRERLGYDYSGKLRAPCAQQIRHGRRSLYVGRRDPALNHTTRAPVRSRKAPSSKFAQWLSKIS